MRRLCGQKRTALRHVLCSGKRPHDCTDGGTGTLSALGVKITTRGSQYQDTEVWSDVGNVTIGLGGLWITGSGTGD